MGYVDAETMIEFKDKIVSRTIDRKVLCKWSGKVRADLDLDFPFFYDNPQYEENVKYSIAVAQEGSPTNHYLKNTNGNGFPISQNDFLHRRKKYLNYQLDTSAGYFKIGDFIDFLFGKNFLNGFDYHFNQSILLFQEFIKKPVCGFELSIQATWQQVLNAFINNPHAYINEYFLLQTGNSGLFDGNFYCYKGKLFIVKDQYERTKGNGIFCKGVYAYIPLFISINEDTRPGDPEVHVYITKFNQ